MHNIENKCKNFKNASTFIYFAKSSLQNSIILSIDIILQIGKSAITIAAIDFQCDLFFWGAI